MESLDRKSPGVKNFVRDNQIKKQDEEESGSLGIQGLHSRDSFPMLSLRGALGKGWVLR